MNETVFLITVVALVFLVIGPRYFRELFDKYKGRRYRYAYDEGYSYALGEYFAGRASIAELESYISEFDKNGFDAGVEEACFVLTKLKLTEEGERYAR